MLNDYKKFKETMAERGHKVYKRGNCIGIVPNNNYRGYGKGFRSASEVVEGTELQDLWESEMVKLVENDHFNTWINKLLFRFED